MIELLAVVAVIGVLAAVVVPAVAQAAVRAKAVLRGVEAFHNARIEAYVENDNQVAMERFATNRPAPIYSDERPGGNGGAQ